MWSRPRSGRAYNATDCQEPSPALPSVWGRPCPRLTVPDRSHTLYADRPKRDKGPETPSQCRESSTRPSGPMRQVVSPGEGSKPLSGLRNLDRKLESWHRSGPRKAAPGNHRFPVPDESCSDQPGLDLPP